MVAGIAKRSQLSDPYKKSDGIDLSITVQIWAGCRSSNIRYAIYDSNMLPKESVDRIKICVERRMEDRKEIV
jgi:hypothetical protein